MLLCLFKGDDVNVSSNEQLLSLLVNKFVAIGSIEGGRGGSAGGNDVPHFRKQRNAFFMHCLAAFFASIALIEESLEKFVTIVALRSLWKCEHESFMVRIVPLTGKYIVQCFLNST